MTVLDRCEKMQEAFVQAVVATRDMVREREDGASNNRVDALRIRANAVWETFDQLRAEVRAEIALL